MTPPALAPFAAVTAVLVVGPGAVFAAPTTGASSRSPIATHRLASHPRAATVGPMVVPAEPATSAARGHGAGQTGLAASGVAVAMTGAGYAVRDSGRVSARPRVGSARIRAPPW